MSVSVLSTIPTLEEEVDPSSFPGVAMWWPLARLGSSFVPVDPQQCQAFLGRSGTGWLSRPGATSVPRRLTSYTVTSAQLRLVPEGAAALPAGELVMLQVAHFDAQAGTAWSVVLVGPSAQCSPEPGRRTRGLVPPVALNLCQAQIFGSALAVAAS